MQTPDWRTRAKCATTERTARARALVVHIHQMQPAVPPIERRRRYAGSASKATNVRVSLLNSTPIRCMGQPRPRYFAA